MATIADLLGGVSPNTPEPPVSPDVLKRRRAVLAAALAKSSEMQRGYTSIAQPIAQGVDAAVNAYLERQAAEQQAAGVASAASAFGSADRATQGIPRPSNGGFGISGPTAIPAPASPSASASGSLPSMAGGGDIGRYAKAIQSVESGGNYAILGPTTKSGDRAIGAYQVMGANVPSWTQAALGTSLTPEQFRADPSAQDAVFAHRFGGYVSKYGNPQDAASAWFTGRPLAQGAASRDVLGTSGSGYVDKFNRALARTASADPQADLPAPGARNAAMDPNQSEVGFQIPPAPQPAATPASAPAPYNDEFPGAMIQMAPQANGGDMVPLPPSRPADLGGGGVSPQALAAALSNGPISAPSPANDATVAALAPPNQPAPNAALIQALDPSALGQSDTTDAAATFSPQLMGPPQQFDPGPAASPMAISVGPSPAPANPAPLQIAQAPVQEAPPLPPPRPMDLAQVDPRADMPAPGAQEAAISLPPQTGPLPQGVGMARLPGPPLLVSNPMGGINPNANDAGAGAFARDPSNRGPAPVQMASNGPTVPVPSVVAGGSPAAVQQAPGQPAPAGTQVAQVQPGAPTDIRPQAQSGAGIATPSNAPATSAAPDLASARQRWMTVMSHPFATKVQQDYARDQLKALDERGSFTQWKDDTGATWQRDQRTGQTSVVHDGVSYDTFVGPDGNRYAIDKTHPAQAPIMVGPQGGIKQLTDPADRAKYGVPKDYTGSAELLPDGGLRYPGKATTEINLSQKAEGAEASARGAGLGKRLNDLADDGAKAAQDSLLYGRLGDVLNSVQTGKRTETLEKIRQMTGIPLDPNTDNVQAMNALIQQLGPSLRVPGSGNQSDRDLANFMQSIPSLAGTPGGNKQIMDTLSGMVEYRKARAAIAADWQLGDLSAKEAQAKIDSIPSPFTAFRKPDAGTAPGASQGAAGAGASPPPVVPPLKPGDSHSVGGVTIRRVN